MTDKLSSLWEIDQNTTPNLETNDLTFYRNALKQGQTYLVQQFSQQVDIVSLVHQRSHFVDQALQQLWQHHISPDTPISLLAVGGYGRGELHPYSDIDLLVILDESVSESPPQGLSDFLTQLWDIGLEIGHSVRTIKECRQQAENDITIATNLLETRLLCGNDSLFSEVQQLTVNHKTWDTRRFYIEKRMEQQQRHLKYNDTANNLEPNIKESPGGLRDLQVISWVAQQHFNVQNLQGLKQKGFLSDSEYNTLESAQRFLWRIRFALHIHAKRKEEKLMIDHQRELAMQLGYSDTDNRLAVENFMKDYYLCARSVGQMNDLLLQLFEENIILADEPRHIDPINRRFQIHNGYLETINSGIFAFYPHAMLELFLMLQQHPEIKGVRADTIRQLYAHIYLINKRFRADIKNRSLFMEIIRQPIGITHEFRRMNKYGVLGAYLPEFGQIVGQMQHDLFHIYTVDEHTLFLVRNLRRFSCDEFKEEFPLCSKIYYELPKTELLFIAGLYHDIAKGRGGDHSLLGVVDAEDFCKLHNLSEFDTKIVTFLVRQHLTMSATAQKTDINDPDVIKAFAAKVKTVDRLNYLYLLTVADIRATNNNLWNGWRDSLLRQLYNATRQWLEHTHNIARNTDEKSQQRKQQALQQLVLQSWSDKQINQIWQDYDIDYFLRHTSNQIVWQMTSRLKNPAATTLINSRKRDQQDTIEIFIFTQDKPRVFAATTACLEQLQLNILDARISSTSNGNTLNTYIVNGPTHNQDEIISKLTEQLANLESIKEYCPILTPRKMKLFETAPIINFQINEQQNYTILELNTHDRPGLLSAISQVFLQCDIQLINAKLATLGDQVEDIFFISNNVAQPLNNNEKEQLQLALIDNLTH
ncbi:MAG: [protein-PII] uridylyltransferase [Methylophaga sp.]|nr:[protein-PII] uridylyltransferase [Methylophaga sp.]